MPHAANAMAVAGANRTMNNSPLAALGILHKVKGIDSIKTVITYKIALWALRAHLPYFIVSAPPALSQLSISVPSPCTHTRVCTERQSTLMDKRARGRAGARTPTQRTDRVTHRESVERDTYLSLSRGCGGVARCMENTYSVHVMYMICFGSDAHVKGSKLR